MWDWAIWGVLIFAGLAAIGAFALIATRARLTWREVKNARRDVLHRLGELARKAEATAEKTAVAGDSAELQESIGRLRVSIERLEILRTALDQARITLGPVTVVVSRR
jgi:hypothetical protein